MTSAMRIGSVSEVCGAALLDDARPAAQSRPLVVLLHAFGLDHTMWDAVRTRLSPQWRVIVPDLWRNARDTATLDEQVDRIAELLRGYETPAWVVGTSYGGVLAQLLALRHPRLVRGIALIATLADAPSDVFEHRAEAGLDEPATLARWFGDSADRTVDHVAYAARCLARVGQDQWRAAWRELARVHLLENLHTVAASCLVVVGDRDVSTPIAMARQIALRVPGAALRVVPGAHHLLVLEQPDEVARLVNEWVLMQEKYT